MNASTRSVRTRDGLSLHVDIWRPTDAPRLVVAIVHGGSEHAGRYERLARDLTRMGALVFGADHRGQGRSQGRRGDIDSFSTYAADLREVLQSMAAELPEAERPEALPWFLFAHSMGGLIAIHYLADDPSGVKLRGAVISSPLFELRVKVNPLKRWAAHIAARIAPKLALLAEIPPEDICRDVETVRRYADDPHRAQVVTARWFGAMLEACARGADAVERIELPMLWYYGSEDRLVSPAAIQAAFERLPNAASRDQTIKRWAGYYHELHNEPPKERQLVIDDVLAWIPPPAASGTRRSRPGYPDSLPQRNQAQRNALRR